MLPPISPDVLARNPQFAHLYNILIEEKLNPDGSLRTDSRDEQALEQVCSTEAIVNISLTLCRSFEHTGRN